MSSDRIRKSAQDSQRAHMQAEHSREHRINAAKHAERTARQRPRETMTFQEYAIEAAKTAKFADETAVTYNALKLCGEAGEIADKLGKGLMSGDFTLPSEDAAHEWVAPELRAAVVKEAGDLLWHLTALLGSMRVTLDEVAEVNLAKLQDRAVRNAILGYGDER